VVCNRLLIGIYGTVGLFILFHALCERAQPEPKPYPGKYDVNDEVDLIVEAMET
jgi:hypothetical protein